MIDSQIRPNKVIDQALLDAVARIPREAFVPEALSNLAYGDEDLMFGNGRSLMEPTTFCRLVQAAEIQKTDVVLDVGCLMGYSSAVLSFLCDTVIGLDQNPTYLTYAENLLYNNDTCNTVFITGDMTEGAPRHGPYDVIVINGTVAQMPGMIAGQLREGGRIVCVVRENENTVGQATVFYKRAGKLTAKALFDAWTPYLNGFEPAKKFVFSA